MCEAGFSVWVIVKMPEIILEGLYAPIFNCFRDFLNLFSVFFLKIFISVDNCWLFCQQKEIIKPRTRRRRFKVG